VNVLDEITQEQIRTDTPELASGDTVRVAARVVEGTVSASRSSKGPSCACARRHPAFDHRPSHRQRRGRGAHLQGEQPPHRQDRSRAPRPGAPRSAVLPAQARRQGGHSARAPRQELDRLGSHMPGARRSIFRIEDPGSPPSAPRRGPTVFAPGAPLAGSRSRPGTGNAWTRTSPRNGFSGRAATATSPASTRSVGAAWRAR